MAGKILIVDDDVRLAGMLVEFLAGESFEPSHALSGAVARARLSQHSFDLVILDVMTGRIDGLELLRCLRIKGQIPVLLLTARGDEEDGILGLELGADDISRSPSVCASWSRACGRFFAGQAEMAGWSRLRSRWANWR